MIIAFSGHSGAGKTSVINRLKKQGLFRGKKVVVREEDTFLTVRIAKFLLGNKIFSGYKHEKLSNRPVTGISGKVFSFLAQFIYPVLLYLDFLGEYIFYELIFRDKVLLRDRYVYDYLVTFEETLQIRNRVVRFVFIHFPKPYLSFHMKIDLANAVERYKDTREGRLEHKKSFHQRIIKSYDWLSKLKGMIPVDSNQSVDMTVRNVARFIELKGKLLKTRRIAIIGLDGSGKTTLATLLCQYIAQFGLGCRVVHFYHENLIYKFLLLLGIFKTGSGDRVQYAKSRAHARRNKSAPFALAMFRFIDSYVQYLYFVVRWSGKTIVFDRFFYDYLVSFEYLGVKWRWMFARFIPRVDCTVLLVSTPEVYYKRKPENTLEFFRKNHKMYRKLSKTYDFKVLNSTTKKPEDILEEFIGLIA